MDVKRCDDTIYIDVGCHAVELTPQEAMDKAGQLLQAAVDAIHQRMAEAKENEADDGLS